MRSLPSFSPNNIYLFLLPDRVLLYRFRNTLLRRDTFQEQTEYPLSGTSHLPQVLQRIRKEFPARADDSWFLGLPLKYFTLVHTQLPRAAEDNLEQAVQYAMMRHVPFELSSVYLHYSSEQRDQDIDIQATMATRRQLRPFLEAVAGGGITLSGVFPSLVFWAALNQEEGAYLSGGGRETEILVWKENRIVFSAWEGDEQGHDANAFLTRTRPMLDNLPAPPEDFFLWQTRIDATGLCHTLQARDDHCQILDTLPAQSSAAFHEQPYVINMVPQAVLKRRRLALWLQVAGLALVLVAVLSYPLAELAGKRVRLNKLQQRVDQLSEQAEALSGLRQENQDIVRDLRSVVNFVNSQPQPGELLKELTEVTPQKAWLHRFIYKNGQIHIQGTAGSASAVVEALENSPLYREVSFESPITSRRNQEVFQIKALTQG